jgi:drug/metabolite transporter (DMT)-like permease
VPSDPAAGDAFESLSCGVQHEREQGSPVTRAWLVWAALAVVYTVWGSTYLAIRVVVQTMPPLLSAGVRFALAGAIVCAFLWLRRGRENLTVSRTQLGAAALVGAALVTGGNGFVMLAEQTVPSAHAALIIGSVPLWVIVLRAIARDRVARATLAGVALGFVGVAVLVLPASRSAPAQLLGLLMLIGASIFWAAGSFYSQRLALPDDPFLSTGLQMVTGGLLVFLIGLAAGEAGALDPRSFSAQSLVSLAYLVLFGSLLAFTAYTWLLQNAPISLVATYAYVNPLVAVFLGWLILAEEITPAMLAGAALIVASVAFVIRKESPAASPPTAERSPVAAAAPGDGR